MTIPNNAVSASKQNLNIELSLEDFDRIVKALEAYTHNTEYLELYQNMILRRLIHAEYGPDGRGPASGAEQGPPSGGPGRR